MTVVVQAGATCRQKRLSRPFSRKQISRGLSGRICASIAIVASNATPYENEVFVVDWNAGVSGEQEEGLGRLTWFSPFSATDPYQTIQAADWIAGLVGRSGPMRRYFERRLHRVSRRSETRI